MASPKVHLYGDWDKASYIMANLDRIKDNNLRYALQLNATHLKKELKKTIKRGSGVKPLAPLTIIRKGHAKPLTDSGMLHDSVESRKIDRYAYVVGIFEDQAHPYSTSDASMSTIAMALEYGATITPIAGERLAIPLSQDAADLSLEYGGVANIPGLFRPKGKSVLGMKIDKQFVGLFLLKEKVKIPKRPFFRNTVRETMPEMQRRWNLAVWRAVNGKKYYAGALR